MAEQKFEDGAVVQLKSGGPTMTVSDFAAFGMGETEESYLCRWFEKTTVKEGLFKEASLRRVD